VNGDWVGGGTGTRNGCGNGLPKRGGNGGWAIDLQNVEKLVEGMPLPKPQDLEFRCTGSKEYHPLLDLTQYPHHHLLSHHEYNAAATLRLQPAQYITIKHRLLAADAPRRSAGSWLRRSAAQSMCKVDVTKVGYLLMWFRELGWVAGPEGLKGEGGGKGSGRRKRKEREEGGVGVRETRRSKMKKMLEKEEEEEEKEKEGEEKEGSGEGVKVVEHSEEDVVPEAEMVSVE